MSTPGFVAEAALGHPSSRHVTSMSEERQRPGRIIGALLDRDAETPTDRIADCVEACRDLGLSTSECGRRCNPTRGSTSQCKLQDNSVNSTLCNLAVWAWEAACIVDCKLLVTDLPGVGPILEQVCTGACHKLGEQMRKPCPPSVICV
jgi:hypothetical protein